MHRPVVRLRTMYIDESEYREFLFVHNLRKIQGERIRRLDYFENLY